MSSQRSTLSSRSWLANDPVKETTGLDTRLRYAEPDSLDAQGFDLLNDRLRRTGGIISGSEAEKAFEYSH